MNKRQRKKNERKGDRWIRQAFKVPWRKRSVQRIKHFREQMRKFFEGDGFVIRQYGVSFVVPPEQ